MTKSSLTERTKVSDYKPFFKITLRPITEWSVSYSISKAYCRERVPWLQAQFVLDSVRWPAACWAIGCEAV